MIPFVVVNLFDTDVGNAAVDLDSALVDLDSTLVDLDSTVVDLDSALVDLDSTVVDLDSALVDLDSTLVDEVSGDSSVGVVNSVLIGPVLSKSTIKKNQTIAFNNCKMQRSIMQ